MAGADRSTGRRVHSRLCWLRGPLAFRRRQIFVGANALSRPRDRVARGS